MAFDEQAANVTDTLLLNSTTWFYGSNNNSHNYSLADETWLMVQDNISAVASPSSATTSSPRSSPYPPLSPGMARGFAFLTTTGNVLGVLSILLNVAFLFAVHFIKDKSSAYFRLMQNLAVSDLLASLSFIVTQNWRHGPFGSIDPQKHYVLMHGLIYVFRGIPWMFFTAYQLTLCSLTVNQWVAVCRPWCYAEFVTPRKVRICTAVVWCLSSLQLLVPLLIVLVLCRMANKMEAMHALQYISRVEIHFWMCFFVVTIVFNIGFDLCIYRKIKQLKMKRRNSGSSADALNLHMKHEAFITLTLLLLASIFCRLPFPLMSFVGLNVGYHNMEFSTVEIIDAFVLFLLYVNFVVDPIIYVTRTRDVRKTYVMFFGACHRKKWLWWRSRAPRGDTVQQSSMTLHCLERTASTAMPSELQRNGSSRSAACQTDEKELQACQFLMVDACKPAEVAIVGKPTSESLINE